MIPIRDENPTRTTPVVVIVLIILNFLVFLVDCVGARGHVGALYEFRMVPQNIIDGIQGFGPTVLPTVQPAWLTIFTSMFMHANILHIGGNMLYLWIFGNNVEDAVGHFKFIFFYLTGGVAAALAHILSTSGNPLLAKIGTVGASGAVAAVLAAYLVLYPGARVICLVTLGYFMTTTAVPAVIVLALWIALQVINASLMSAAKAGGGVAYWAHIGGFVAGIIMIYILGGKRLLRRRGRDSYDRWEPYRD